MGVGPGGARRGQLGSSHHREQRHLECGALGPHSFVTMDSVLMSGQWSGYYHMEEGVAPTPASWDGLRHSLI